MIGIIFKKKRPNPSSVRTIPIAELAPLWRNPDEPSTFSRKLEAIKADNSQKTIVNNVSSVAVNLETLVTRTDLHPTTKNNDYWYDEKKLIDALKWFLGSGKTFAFVLDGKCYFTLDKITETLNTQRSKHNLDLMNPKSVIEFLKQDRGFDSGKYLMRFESGLPTKIYLYTHPSVSENESVQQLPVDETGRRLKSLKPIKERNP